MDVYWNTIAVVILTVLSFIAGAETENHFWKQDDVHCERVYGKEKDPHEEQWELIEGWISSDRAKVDPEFEITMVVSVFHLFDSYEELQHTYIIDGWGTNEVDGWSDCEWQKKHNYAACDIFTVRPEYVRDDPAMDTIGHEVWHGVAGDYHE